MDDRELLELAAKAAGYEYAKHGGYIVVEGIPGNWNPLTNDGDALRLAVKLGLTISYYGATHVCESESGEYLVDEIDTEGDGLAATRRAIVRVAAEIGRAM